MWEVLEKLQNCGNNHVALSFSCPHSSPTSHHPAPEYGRPWGLPANLHGWRSSFNLRWEVMQWWNDGLGGMWAQGPEPLLVWGDGHGCSMRMFGWSCGIHNGNPREPTLQPKNHEAVSICRGVVKMFSKRGLRKLKKLFEEDSKRPEIWMCYPIHTNIHLAEDESLNQGDWPQRLSNHWLPLSYVDTGVTPRKPGLKRKELKTTTTEKTQPHTVGDIISQT